MSKELVNPDPFADVQFKQIENRGRKTDKFWVEIYDPLLKDFREIPGVGVTHSAEYQLISNRQLHTMATTVMDDMRKQHGITFKPLGAKAGSQSYSPIYWNGRRFMERWYTENAAVQTPSKTDMMFGVEVRNSYDGSCQVSVAFFAMHAVCTNQFHARNLLGDPIEFPHVNRKGGSLEDDIGWTLDLLQAKTKQMATLAPTMKQLAANHLESFDGFLKIRDRIKTTTGVALRDTALLDELSGRGISAELKLGTTYEDPTSYWAIANAHTAICTHEVGGPRGADHSERVLDFLIEEVRTQKAA